VEAVGRRELRQHPRSRRHSPNLHGYVQDGVAHVARFIGPLLTRVLGLGARATGPIDDAANVPGGSFDRAKGLVHDVKERLQLSCGVAAGSFFERVRQPYSVAICTTAGLGAARSSVAPTRRGRGRLLFGEGTLGRFHWRFPWGWLGNLLYVAQETSVLRCHAAA